VVTATLFADEVADLLEFGDWPAAVHRAFELGLISADDIEQAFDSGADVIAHLQR
jgi:hypothetical protein